MGGVGEVARGRVALLIGEGEVGPGLSDLDALIPVDEPLAGELGRRIQRAWLIPAGAIGPVDLHPIGGGDQGADQVAPGGGHHLMWFFGVEEGAGGAVAKLVGEGQVRGDLLDLGGLVAAGEPRAGEAGGVMSAVRPVGWTR